jgi:predicted metalloendopeptidase
MKSGIDTSFIDQAVRPQDDLYRHFNGKWLSTHEIPSDRASDGVAYALHDEAEAQVRKIIERVQVMPKRLAISTSLLWIPLRLKSAALLPSIRI